MVLFNFSYNRFNMFLKFSGEELLALSSYIIGVEVFSRKTWSCDSLQNAYTDVYTKLVENKTNASQKLSFGSLLFCCVGACNLTRELSIVPYLRIPPYISASYWCPWNVNRLVKLSCIWTTVGTVVTQVNVLSRLRDGRPRFELRQKAMKGFFLFPTGYRGLFSWV